MTTIAWDGRTIAADRRLGGWQTANKLFRLRDGTIFAGAGRMDDVAEVLAWLQGGRKPDDKPEIEPDDSEFFIVQPDGKAYWLTTPFLRSVKIEDQFYAIGSGAEFAIGAMRAGVSAKRAVEIACTCDPQTGKGVVVMRLKK